MRLDQLRVELRPRSSWEAIELGTALVRTHARAVWLPWLLLSLPVFAALNVAGWTLDLVPAAAVVMWWLKPLFDRVPLYVVSRAVFGDAPSVRETVSAQWRWGWRPMPGYLTWRRFGLARALFLPIDLLEGGSDPAQRRRVIGGAARGVATLLAVVCLNFELVLVLGAAALGFMFVPTELLSESARAAYALVTEDPPPWLLVLANLVLWLATSLVEPFYVGAGFGMYLDRRTQIEAWDIEIAFRRMRQRLGAAGAVLACVLALGMTLPGMARAADAPPVAGDPHAAPAQRTARQADAAQDGPPTLPRVFAKVEDGTRFDRAVAQAYADPLLSPKRIDASWEKKNRSRREPKQFDGRWLAGVAAVLAWIGEHALWLLAALLLLALALSWRTWLPWLRGMRPVPRLPDAPIARQQARVAPDALPEDVAGAARALWQEGRRRRALALLYRASVAWMVARTGAVLVPGATEAECLRAARALHDADQREAFARVVRVWQYAAYAERLPDADEFEGVLVQATQQFGWPA